MSFPVQWTTVESNDLELESPAARPASMYKPGGYVMTVKGFVCRACDHCGNFVCLMGAVGYDSLQHSTISTVTVCLHCSCQRTLRTR